jgi:glycerol dehydrogenase-like iron-containing ADH family enzyme
MVKKKENHIMVVKHVVHNVETMVVVLGVGTGDYIDIRKIS